MELTESTVMSNPQFMKKKIQDFLQNGFKVWMDDFGSGNSSLNTLMDFSFSEIKFDMGFMKEFNERSKTIVKHCVKMAKDLKIQPLMEGVETEELFEFIKEIGCTKAQGYLFSKPLSMEEVLETLAQKQISMESPKFHNYYDDVSNIDYKVRLAKAIGTLHGETFNVLHLNQTFRDTLKAIHLAPETINAALNNPASIFRNKLLKSGKIPNQAGEEISFDYPYLSNLLRLRIRTVSKIGDNRILRVILENITADTQSKNTDVLDNARRNLCHIYDGLLNVDLLNDSYQLIALDTSIPATAKLPTHFSEANQQMAKHVFERDLERYKRYQDTSTLLERIQTSSAGYVISSFRFYGKNKQLLWKQIAYLLVSEPKEEKLLMAIRTLTDSENEEPNHVFDIQYSTTKKPFHKNSETNIDDVFNSLLVKSPLQFFLKDKDRKFLGVSHAFLKAYGLKDSKAILGKTDEEVG